MPNKDQKKNKRSIGMFGYKNIIKIKKSNGAKIG